MFAHMYLILILNQFHLFASMHPEFYPCESHTSKDGHTNIDCQHRRLSKIPRFSSLSVVSLNLNKNHIHYITGDAFSGLPNLKHLSLMWNCVPDYLKEQRWPSCSLNVDPKAFVGLKNLTSLQLAGNSLKTIPPLPKQLLVLGLEFNNIFHIVKPLGTPLLKQLLLSKNCFYANPCYQSYFIDPHVFQDLPELLNLTLSYNNVTIVPPHLPLSLESLDLGENKITSINKESFANLTHLRHLNLGWNCQRCDHASEPCFPCQNNQSLHLHPDAFVDQRDSLITLSLRGNSLRTFPQYLFMQLHKLRDLDLSDNFLAYTIQNGTFYEELQNVVSLSLLYNYEPLNTFSELILSPAIEKMTALRALYLSGLFFKELSNDSLAPLIKLPRLEYLELRMNFICSISIDSISQLRTLRRVGLSQNMLAFSPCYSTCNSEATSKYLTTEKHHDHKHQTLQIQDAPLPKSELNTERGSKGDVAIQKGISMWHFKKQICSKSLFFDLSQNNIPWLNASTFRGMENVVCIDLSYNYISQSLNGQQFTYLTKLAFLNMAHNRIDLYSEKALKEISGTLKGLDLSNNEFHFVMKGMGHRFTFLSHLSSLKVLSLANNHIGLRISNILNSTSLKYLEFSGNRLDIMWDSRLNQYVHFFQGLTNLTHLDISENQLKSFPPEVIVNLPPSLQVLRVDSNMLSYFPWGNVSVLKQLCYLNLSSNMLSYLPNSHFDLRLISLDLSHNRLVAIPRAFLSQAAQLKHLMLNHNQLKILDVYALPLSFHKGYTFCPAGQNKNNSSCRLVLHANPFICSCIISGFAKFLRETELDIPHLTTQVHCAYPESLAGVNVLSIDLRSCQEIFGGFALLCTLLLTLAATGIPLLKHLYGWDLWYCIQILWTGHKGHTPANSNMTDDQYDAFVVFDTSNIAVRDWIYKEMIVRLENKGRWRFRLCLEERDWMPGVSCIENLHKAVYSSRKTVFVLTSPSGYSHASGVVRQAFLLVQQRLLDEKVDVAVLVLLDLVFPKFKYLQMRKRLCKKSVLSWPKNPRVQPLFWNDLRVALVSDNAKAYNKNVTESFF